MSKIPQQPTEKDIPKPPVAGRYGVGLFG